MSELYWRSSTWHEPGNVIEGRWGQVVMGEGPQHPQSELGHVHFGREMILEAARRDVRPEAVSRLSAAFAFEAKDDAVGWQDHRHLLYVVTVSADTPQTTVNMSVIDGWYRLHTFDDVWEWACEYWGRPAAAHETPEVLIGGRMRIERLIRDLRYGTLGDGSSNAM